MAWELRRGDEVLGVLSVDGGDFPWHFCQFEATEAFAAYRPLFDRENELGEVTVELRSDTPEFAKAEEELDTITGEIYGLGLTLHDTGTEGVIAEFLLHIEGDRASLRY